MTGWARARQVAGDLLIVLLVTAAISALIIGVFYVRAAR